MGFKKIRNAFYAQKGQIGIKLEKQFALINDKISA